MSKNFNWSEIFNSLDCEKYNPKGKTKEEGLHCYTIILHYFKELGYDVSFDNYIIEDLTQDNINQKWKEDPKRVVDLCIKYFESISREVKSTEIKIGDILIVKIKKDILPVIYCGNGKVFVMLEEGSVRLPLHRFEIISCHRVDKNE